MEFKSLKFNHKTNWTVITGAPSSGKTSVIEELARRGHATGPDVARDCIMAEIVKGHPLAWLREDENNKALQRRILAGKIALEQTLDPEREVFLDFGIPDSLNYFPLAGLDTAEVVEACRARRYRAVFVFDRLPFVKDIVRSEDDAAAAMLDSRIDEHYRSLGYVPVRVPVMAVEDRADFILAGLALAV